MRGRPTEEPEDTLVVEVDGERSPRLRTRAVVAGAAVAAALVAVGAVAVALGVPGDRTGAGAPDGPPLTATAPADAGAWPAVTTPAELGFRCGEPVGAITDPPGDADLHLEVAVAPYPEDGGDPPTDGVPLDGAALTQGPYWAIDAAMVNGTGRVLSAGLDASDVPGVVLVHDGAVVGMMATAVGDVGGVFHEPATWQPGDSISTHGVARVESCAADGADQRLPAGEYDVYVTAAVLTVPVPVADELDPDAALGEHLLTLVGGPWRVTLDEGTPPGDPWDDDLAAGRAPGLEDVPLGFEGLGPLLLGAPVPDPPAPSDMIRWEPAYCPGAAEPGRWIPNYGRPWQPGDQLPSFGVTVRDDRVVRIDLHELVTTELVNIADPLSEAQAAYPELALLRTAAADGGPVDVWSVTRGDATMLFEVLVPGADPPPGTFPGGPGTIAGIALVTDLEHYDRPTWEGHACG